VERGWEVGTLDWGVDGRVGVNIMDNGLEERQLRKMEFLTRWC
jgi:hypothetical protein